jgi:hypothetical protein
MQPLRMTRDEFRRLVDDEGRRTARIIRPLRSA